MAMKNLIAPFALGSLLFFSSRVEEPRILIIGDSISLGYTPFVQEHFGGRAYVAHNPGNAEHTGTGKAHVADWAGREHWDIIQFNWGLWDLCYRHPDSPVQGHRDKVNGSLTFSVEEYQANLDTIVTRLREASDARFVFVTTSYVPVNEAGRFRDDPKKYNAAAVKVMQKHGIPVNDIYAKSRAIHRKWGMGTDDVHYTPTGYQLLSEPVIAFLEKELRELR